jgi:hypothetical protein
MKQILFSELVALQLGKKLPAFYTKNRYHAQQNLLLLSAYSVIRVDQKTICLITSYPSSFSILLILCCESEAEKQLR